MSLYGEYVREKYGQTIIESDIGFLVYKVIDNTCFIETLFVSPDHRNTGEARRLFNTCLEQIKDCINIIARIDTLTNDATTPILVFSTAGFRVVGTDNDQHVIMEKRL